MKSAALATVAILLAVPAIAQDIPQLVGTWKSDTGVTYVIAEQDGSQFKGEVTYPLRHGGGPSTDPVVGSVAPDGETVVMAAEEGHHVGTLQSATVLDLCYVEAGESPIVACAQYTKQP